MPPETIRYERRALPLTPDAATDSRQLTGYAALFDSPSQDLGGFTETIAPGAFQATLGADDVRALWNHNPDIVLGRTSAKTLSLAEDATGLRFTLDLPETQAANDLLALVKRGDVGEMSFGFQTITDEWNTVDGVARRRLIEVKLYDISPVAFPAYEGTSVGARHYRAVPFGYREDVPVTPPAPPVAPDLGPWWRRLAKARMP